jgi:hypothetical protein
MLYSFDPPVSGTNLISSNPAKGFDAGEEMIIPLIWGAKSLSRRIGFQYFLKQ